MSEQEEAEGREMEELMMQLCSPMDLDGDLYFHLPPRPQSPGLCLSPLWNFYGDNYSEYTGGIHVMTSTANGLPPIDFPRSGPGDPLISQSLAANRLTLYWAPLLRDVRSVFLILSDLYSIPKYLRTLTLRKINYASVRDRVCTVIERWLDCCLYKIRMIWEGKRTQKEARDILLRIISAGKIFFMEKIMPIIMMVKWKSSETFDLPLVHVVDKHERNRLAEISQLMTVVSKFYKLPLAQTWVPTRICQLGSRGQSSRARARFEEGLTKEACLSTGVLPSYYKDIRAWCFMKASTEHELLEGQYIVGRAYLSRKSYFCEDVTQFQKTEYSLVDDACMYGLRSCLAVPICDNQTGEKIYILEFFLPHPLADFGYAQKVLDFVSATINQSSPNLRMADKEFSKDGTSELIYFYADMKPASSPEDFQKQKTIKPSKYGGKNSPTFETSWFLHVLVHEQPGNLVVDCMYRKTKMDESERSLPITISEEEYKRRVEALERIYGKQLYGKSLPEAADCLGVSRSTMKRICRKHGISRWRSYKRKMTERFSRKQTHENELLQGSAGSISCNSQNLYSDSARAWPEIHLGELPTENISFTITNLQTQSAKRQKSQCSGELPSIVEPHLENIVSNIDVPTPKLSNGSAIQGERTAFIKIKATYGENFIRCTLHYPSALVDLEKEVQKRLKLQLGNFSLKYLDEEGDWVMIACDEDLDNLLEVFLKKGMVRMLVEDINHL